MWIPRMGQEVVVGFLEGDPDRPLITGRVYNAEETIPYKLPDHQTVSTMKSRSSKGGGDDNYNELRFEDKKGSEQIFINAEKDMDLRVEKESREFVGGSRHLIVTKDQLEEVDGDKHAHVKGKHAEAIDGDESLNVKGEQKIQIGQGQSIQVGKTLNEKYGENWLSETVKTVHVKAGMTLILEAGMQLSLKGPGGFVDIGPAGVSIQGTMVLINSGGSAGSGPDPSPQSPESPKAPDKADDGSKFGKS
jgi:type VI secretion system secreted protein VgrG